MLTTTRSLRVLGSAALLFTVASATHAQTMRASCDNRQGRSFADVVDSSDPNDSSYNVDPSEIYKTFANIGHPNNQSSGANTATANALVNSKFVGTTPGTRCGGIVINDTSSASATRVNQNVWSFASQTESACFMVGAVSAGNPLRMRLKGGLTMSGGATGRLRLQLPSGGDIVNITAGSIDRVLQLTTPGEYRLTAQLDTGNVQPGSGSQSRSVNIAAAFVCMADVNGSGTITVQDIFDFLSQYFAGSLAADANASGAISVQDIFDFLAQYFQGCNF